MINPTRHKTVPNIPGLTTKRKSCLSCKKKPLEPQINAPMAAEMSEKLDTARRAGKNSNNLAMDSFDLEEGRQNPLISRQSSNESNASSSDKEKLFDRQTTVLLSDMILVLRPGNRNFHPQSANECKRRLVEFVTARTDKF